MTNVVREMKRSWPWFVVQGLVQVAVFFLAAAAFERLGWARTVREPLAGVVAFFAMVLIWVAEAVLRERAQSRGQEQP